MQDNGKSPKIKNLTLDANALKECYMPFIQGGGLFIATADADYHLGEEIFLKIALENYPEPFKIIGKIAWLSAQAVENQWGQGIGVQLQEAEGQRLHQEIQIILQELDNNQGAE